MLGILLSVFTYSYSIRRRYSASFVVPFAGTGVPYTLQVDHFRHPYLFQFLLGRDENRFSTSLPNWWGRHSPVLLLFSSIFWFSILRVIGTDEGTPNWREDVRHGDVDERI